MVFKKQSQRAALGKKIIAVTLECLLDAQEEEAGEASVVTHSSNPSTQEAEARLL